MAAKQSNGLLAPDGSTYVTLTDGAGTLAPASGGGGGGGASTIADGADVTQGALADAAATAGGAGSLSAKLRLMTTQLSTLNTTLGSPAQAGATVAVTGTFFQVTQPISGTVTVSGPTPDGTAASTNPVLVAGTTDGTATGAVAVPKITAGGVLSVDGSASTQPVSGTVAVTTIIPGTAATNLGKAEDSAHASGDVGVFGLALANEAQTVLAQDGDYIGHGADTKGNTFVTGPVASAATDSGNPVKVGGRYNSAVQAFTNGQRADLQVDQRGGLLIQDGQAIPSVSVTSAATLFTVADTSGYGSVSIQVTSAGTTCTITYEASEDGTTWFSVAGFTPLSTGSAVPVTTSTTAILLNFPTVAKQFRARVSTYTSGTVTIQGSLRKDALPKIGVAINASLGDTSTAGSTALPTLFEVRTSNKTGTSSGQYIRPVATTTGVQVAKPYQVPELDWTYAAASGGITNTTTAVTIVSAAGAGIRNYLTGLQISNSTLGAGTELAIRDGAGGTVLWRGILATAASDPGAISFPSPLRGTANTLMEVVTLTASVTGAVYFNAQGYQAT